MTLIELLSLYLELDLVVASIIHGTLSRYLTMSSPIEQVEQLILAHLASKGRYPRPDAVTPEDVERVRRFAIAFVRDITRMAPQPPRQQNGLAHIITTLDKQMDMYEKGEFLNEAKRLIPMEQLHKTAKEIQEGESPLPGYEDALAAALVKWFKPNFFVWIDPIKCTVCQGETTHKGMGTPSEDDLAGGAGRVELHQCNLCGNIVRFPRYNNLHYLMRFKKGRCGEFANLFTLFIRAVGLRARYVWNAEDHVWNEYYSPALNRWVHMDSCENARDQHLLYDVGWGKKQSYILAFSIDGAQDVSRGYIKDFDAALPRRNKANEGDLQQALGEVTRRRRVGLSAQKLQELEREDRGEMEFLQGKTQPEESLPARESGTAEWKAARGEDGSGA